MPSWSQLKEIIERSKTQNAPPVIFYVTVPTKQTTDNEFTDVYRWELCLRSLSLQQQLGIRNKKFLLDAYQVLINKLLQDFVLKIYLFEESSLEIPEPIRYTYNEFGKPLLSPEYDLGMNLHFSMSNSADIVGMVVTTHPAARRIGIDLSNTNDDVLPVGDPGVGLETYESVFFPSEYQHLQLYKDDARLKLLLNQYWALKESYTKLLGVGLNMDLSRLEFSGVNFLDVEANKLGHPEEQIPWVGPPVELRLHDIEQALSQGYTNRVDLGLLKSPNIVVSTICEYDGTVPDSTPVVVNIPLSMLVEFTITHTK
ncbi:hypothetical protein BABINDRAFT_166187 [Babjeviella inositovora NRRL Y-12698]|uniref:holo-[acyl-carrier-protein] synthase n=1 Tax=Babjeviella inositovora NRRL Y-12698 TaxID=984486 RepID=A0A1E3QUH4_9ASCO|nr:uncharacterized protein BABINDRAFT_166187 [Babjeviella inositovora NRRL Y-12698]ODQ80577.1 hypothetical protein BABINDRAFT_166187 [Babjeviella inositovora NRRL Y-12698]